MNIYLCSKWSTQGDDSCVVCAKSEEDALRLATPHETVLNRLRWSVDLVGTASAAVPEGVILRSQWQK